MDIKKIQAVLTEKGFGGWLFFDHHQRDPLAYRILGLSETTKATRRWYYFIPATGTPQKLVHNIERFTLDSLPGEKHRYSSWHEQRAKLSEILSGQGIVAMQYSPDCAIPYVSLVDAGTIELVRSSGVQVVSSADLVQEFEATWSDEQFQMHLEAGRRVDAARQAAFQFIGEKLSAGVVTNEFQIQQFILSRFAETGLITDHGPIVAVNANASDPHYEPTADRNAGIRKGDLVLLDMWAKLDQPRAVYYDITWTGFCGDTVPERIERVFSVVRDARKLASQFVIDRTNTNTQTAGFQVDDVSRGFIRNAGYEQFFVHRTGHSIGTDVHGTGANMDNLESHDERLLIPHTCFSIEPGVYLPDFGIRSEVNVYVAEHSAQVTGEEQNEVVLIR